MTGAAVLARIAEAGAEVVLRGGAPVLRSPHPLPPELLAEARAHKAELLALLRAEAAPGAPPSLSPLAAALLAAAVAAGPADDVDQAEAEAIRALAEAPAPKPAEAHREHVRALADAALLRPPSWADAKALPSPGCRCSCCHGSAWWCEAEAPPCRGTGQASGWRCLTCHPPDHLRPGEVWEVRT